MDIGQGDIFWLNPTGSTGDAEGYSHPHIVIQNDILNRSRIKTVVMCALTSNKKRANEPGNVLLDIGEADLPRHSIVVVSQSKPSISQHWGRISAH